MKKRYLIFKAHKRRSKAKKDREFARTFAQHKNVIAKHASLGEKRRREDEYKEQSVQRQNQNKLKNIKRRSESYHSHIY